MSDLLDEAAPAKRRWIPRETWRQEKAVVFARDAIAGDHKFLAHDRSKAASPDAHKWEAKRGVRKGTPDTQLILPNGRHVWFEFKAPGQKVHPGDDQDLMLAALRKLGDAASWGVTIEDLRRFYAAEGVPLVVNAAYRAMVLDGLVDSRIAKAEGKVPTAPKRKGGSRPRPAGKTATVAQGHKLGVWR